MCETFLTLPIKVGNILFRQGEDIPLSQTEAFVRGKVRHGLQKGGGGTGKDSHPKAEIKLLVCPLGRSLPAGRAIRVRRS